MKIMRSLYCFIFPLFILFFPVHAQERCATEKFDSLRRLTNPSLETKVQFEKCIKSKLQAPGNLVFRTQSTYTIPVVVHVIHSGQALGSGSNISDAQILSQINVLNKDFQRLNSDMSQTPPEFSSAAGSLDIQFVLAKQDPNGNATSGVIRVNGGKSVWY